MKKQRKMSNKKQASVSQPSKEHVDYLRKMTLFWVGMAIASILVAIPMVHYSSALFQFVNENRGGSISYLLIYVVWKIYRVKSRHALRSMPNFTEKMKSDYKFAKHFNNSEIIKTLINYLLISVPLIYAAGLAKDLLLFFGYQSAGFGGDLQQLLISTLSSCFAVVLGVPGAYLYDKIKHKLP